MDPVVHFEMPYENQKRLSAFYAKVFGWKMEFMPEMGSYVVATTSPVDKNRMHKKKGAINGGFYPKGDYGDIPHLIVQVMDLEAQMKAVKRSGGNVEGKPAEIKDVGMFVMIRDTEGNRVGMLQPSIERT